MLCLRWPLTAVLLLACLAVPSLCRAQPNSCSAAAGVVFTLDGAGDFNTTTRGMQQTLQQQHIPLAVQPFHWSHGTWRIAADHMHGTHTREAGQCLAEQLIAWKQANPHHRVYLVAHSAGCAVALYAARQLPPHTLERIVLLAPAVSTRYDLRPALRASCQGIDVFYSGKDWICLGIGIAVSGTTDRRWTAAAGRVGFRPGFDEPGDELLCGKLRQYPWNPGLAITGHTGGHYGVYQEGFLATCVLPLLWPPCPPRHPDRLPP